MTCFPLLAPFQAVRKPTQRRTSLYSGPTWTDQVTSRGGPRSALGDRLTGEADDRRAGRAGRVGGEGRDSGPPDSERAGLPGGPHHPTSKSQARSTRSREHSSTPRRHAKIGVRGCAPGTAYFIPARAGAWLVGGSFPGSDVRLGFVAARQEGSVFFEVRLRRRGPYGCVLLIEIYKKSRSTFG